MFSPVIRVAMKEKENGRMGSFDPFFPLLWIEGNEACGKFSGFTPVLVLQFLKGFEGRWFCRCQEILKRLFLLQELIPVSAGWSSVLHRSISKRFLDNMRLVAVIIINAVFHWEERSGAYFRALSNGLF
jgi:hypothetical protein